MPMASEDGKLRTTVFLNEDSIAALPSPSCSPTPPTEVVCSQGGGNLYTDDEKVYFVQFLKWWLMKYPDVDIYSDKHQFLDALHDNVPSHSIKSWGNHWRSNKKSVAQIIAKAKTKSLTNFWDNDRAVSSSLSSCVYESGAVEVGECSLAYFDRAFNRDERHALAKRIASEGLFLAWFGLPEEQRWKNIHTTVNLRQPNYWPAMFQLADRATLTEIEQLVKKYLTKKF
ncbi:hypothetical protein BD410DRAFT_843910 [Rickenella mellea]|uniref:Uncharacterized protein n=1 Tax=Rickenella mellea TaxID=50990 RepID=A0A4Y7PPQ6_9AGAM|nr:hypothetical protein BD410DRAFT_843910 [Rickenella mellea]